MTIIAELTVPAEEFALGRTLPNVPDATVEFERIVTHSQEWGMPFLWARSGNLDPFDREIRRDSTVENVKIADEFDGTRLYRVVWSDEVKERINAIFDRAGTLIEATGEAVTGGRYSSASAGRTRSPNSRSTSPARTLRSPSNGY